MSQDLDVQLQEPYVLFKWSLGTIGAAIILGFTPQVVAHFFGVQIQFNENLVYGSFWLVILIASVINGVATMFAALRCFSKRSVRAWVALGVLLWISVAVILAGLALHART
jgi:hypothetical protein